MGDLTRQTFESFVDLMSAQIRLARTEISMDAATLLQRSFKLLIIGPIILVGYVFACAALAAWLAGVVGWAAAFGIVAVCNLAAGGIGAAVVVGKLKRVHPIDDTVASVKTTVRQVGTAMHSSS